jgi:type I restriction enzyme S subunit
MAENKEVKIPEMLFFQEGPGVRNTQYTTSGVKLLNVANLVEGKVDLSTSDRYISEEEAYGKYRHFLCDEGDFIVASSGIKVDYIDKKMGFITKEMLPLCMNTSTIRFKVLDDSKLNIKYFMYFLKSNAFKKQLAKQITGSAQLNYGPSHLKQMTFPLIDIKSQNVLVDKLDHLVRIIDKKNESIKKYDELIKARFVEMFGGFDLAPQCNEWTKLSELGEIVSGSTPKTGTAEYWDGDICWITPAELNSMSGIVHDSKKKITEAGKNSCSLRLMPVNTVILSSRAPIGKVAILGKEMCCNQGFKNIICNEMISPKYLYYLLAYNTDYLNSLGRGATFKEISKKIVEDIKIPLPSIEQQVGFINFAEQVDKSKFAVQKSLEKTQQLFDSLMQEYFG